MDFDGVEFSGHSAIQSTKVAAAHGGNAFSAVAGDTQD